MDSQEDQGKSSEMVSKASSTIGSEANQQTTHQLTAYARDATQHLEYSNKKHLDLTTRRQSQPSTRPKAHKVSKPPKRFRCGERLANGRICRRTSTNRRWMSNHIEAGHRTGPSPAKQPAEDEAVDVQTPERQWCPLDPPVQVQAKPKKLGACDDRPAGRGKAIQVVAEAILSAPGEHLSFQEIKDYVAEHYPWYVQPIRKQNFQRMIDFTLNHRKSKPFEQVPEMQGRWRVTASYRRDLRELESLPVFSTE